MRLALHPEARAELRTAALWYEEQRPGLGDEFVAAASTVMDRIEQLPASFPTWPGTEAARTPIRRALLRRFPYAIAFEAHEDHVLVSAIAHVKRRPLYWIARSY